MKNKIILFATVMSALVVYYIINPSDFTFTPKCLFKLITGWNCPSCGIQRAVHALLHGDLYQAMCYNWFLILALPYAIALIIAQWLVSPDIKTKMYKILGNRYVIYTYIVLFFVWGVIRNILGI